MTYFLTFATYGTHLPGDPRGTTDRHEGQLEARPALETFASNLMAEPPFRLERSEDRQTVVEAIVEVCRYREWRLIALQVRPEHVHGVIQAEGVTSGRVMGDWKRYGTRALKLCWPKRRHFWASGGYARSVPGAGLNRIVRYVLDEQGDPMETYNSLNIDC